MYITDQGGNLSNKSIVNKGDISRIARAMKKACTEKKLTIGFIGGSITEGAGASRPVQAKTEPMRYGGNT